MAPEPTDFPSQARTAGHAPLLLDLFDRLVALVPDLAPDAVSADAHTLRTDLAGQRKDLAIASDPYEIERIAGGCLRACEAFLRRSRAHLTEREREFVELVGVLHQAIDTLSGGARVFHGRLSATTERLAELAALDDIKQLKQQVQSQVDELRRVTIERQRDEERCYASLAERVVSLEAKLVRAEDEAARDPLTGIANRGAFDRMLRHVIETTAAGGGRLVVGMVDVDNFKQVNDTHGHVVGDRILVCVAQHFARALRSTDFVARYGGEEFALVMPDIALETAQERIAAIRRTLAPSYQYERDGDTMRLSFSYSVGLTDFVAGDDATSLVARADAALYDAKRRGKDCIVTRRKSGGLLRGLLRSS